MEWQLRQLKCSGLKKKTPAQLPVCQMAWYWTRSSAVGGRWLTARATTRPCRWIFVWTCIQKLVLTSNPDGDEILYTRPDRPWGPPSLPCNGYQLSFPGVMRSGRSAGQLPPFSTEVKERLGLYLYSPSGLSWPIVGWTSPLLRETHGVHIIKKKHFQLCKTLITLNDTMHGFIMLHQVVRVITTGL